MKMLSEVIRKFRQKAFMSQDIFAAKIHVSVSTVNRWETGKVRPNLSAMKQLKLFCDEYSLPYEEIEKEWFAYSKAKENDYDHR